MSGSTNGNTTTLTTSTSIQSVSLTAGTYEIFAYGAEGGFGPSRGGFGAEMGGVFQLSLPQTLSVVVGAEGTGAGGGGGSFVVLGSTPLVVAGGGGGGGFGTNGNPGVTSIDGTFGGVVGDGSGSAFGRDGNGGYGGDDDVNASEESGTPMAGGGGGGFLSAGTSGSGTPSSLFPNETPEVGSGGGGYLTAGGPVGGTGTSDRGFGGGDGGFGGGGGGAGLAAGGGGGYSGGGGGSGEGGEGGGGGSFLASSAADAVEVGGYNDGLGNGMVVITQLFASTIAGPTLNQTETVTGPAPVTPFAGVIVTDPNSANPASPNGPTETITVTPSSTTSGTLSDSAGGSVDSSTGVYTVSGTPSQVSTDLAALTFLPASYQRGTTTFTLTDTNWGGLVSTPATTSVNVVAPTTTTISDTQPNQPTTDEAPINPFSNVTITDPGAPGSIDTVSVTLSSSANGSISDPDQVADNGVFDNGAYIVSGTESAVTAALRNIVFTPTVHQVAPGQTVTTTFTISDVNGSTFFRFVTDNITSVVATAVNDKPTITGTKANQATTTGDTIEPFAGVTIADPDVGVQDSLTITLTGATGTVSGAGLGQTGAANTYALAATTPDTLTSELDALVFTPSPNGFLGMTGTTTFTLTASQIAGGSTVTASDGTTTVVDTRLEPSRISVPNADLHQTSTGFVPVTPFTGVDIVDNNVGATETVTVTPTSGFLLDLNAENDGSTSSNGTITLTGDPNTVTTELDALQFFPTFGQFGETTFTISDTNSLDLTASNDKVTVTEQPLCFLAGTMIRTPAGEIPIERLAPGDIVTTWAGIQRPITWVGQGKVLATPARRSAATPVIVRKGALAENMPAADLRVTKGHSLLLDDVLIPIEFLVNHRSILWDDHAREVALYHIELATHDVLVANGAPAESYRDDGNRWLFQNANTGWDQPAKQPCAPVLTGGPVVDAVWRRLLDRSSGRRDLPLTDDPDLHLMVDGVRLDAAPVGRSGVYTFRLLGRPGAVRLVSRAAAPAEIGLARDPRLLGVAVRQVKVWQGWRLALIEAADSGFHAYEADLRLRWTDGDAVLPAELFCGFAGPLELDVCLSGATQYPASADTNWAAVA